MSFGGSISDIIAGVKLCQTVYKAFRDGPKEYHELAQQAKALHLALCSLRDDIEDPNSLLNRKGEKRKDDLMSIVNSAFRSLEGIEELIDKHISLKKDSYGKRRRVWDSYRMGRADVDSLRGKFTFYTSTISVFMDSLGVTAISRIERTLDKIYARMMYRDGNDAMQSQVSLMSFSTIASEIGNEDENAWELIQRELTDDGIPPAQVAVYKEEIIDHIKALVNAEGLGSDSGSQEWGTEIVQSRSLLEDKEEARPGILRAFMGDDPGSTQSIPMWDHVAEMSSKNPRLLNRWIRHASQTKLRFDMYTSLRILGQGRSGFEAEGSLSGPSCSFGISL